MEKRLKEIILSHSDEFSQRFLIAKNRFSGIQVEEFAVYLDLYLSPIIEKRKDAEESVLLEFVRTGYSSILELLGKFILGSKTKFIEFEKEWKIFYFNNPKHTILLPDLYFSAIPNSILNLRNQTDINWNLWKEKFSKVLELTEDRIEIYKLGFILAWICGKSIWRETSLEYLEKISNRFDSLLFDTLIPLEKRNEFISYIRENPWNSPESFFTGKPEKIKVQKKGNFVGLGGNFKNPPVFFSNYPDILTDGENYFKIHADYFGVSLERLNSENLPPKTRAKENRLDVSVNLNMLQSKGKLYSLPSFPSVQAEIRSDYNSFYIISPYSFSFLVGGILS